MPEQKGLSGVGNTVEHQRIISQIMETMKARLHRNRKIGEQYASPNYEVLSEIDLSKVAVQHYHTNRDYNFDLCLWDTSAKEPVICIEIFTQETLRQNREKLLDAHLNIPSVIEVFGMCYSLSKNTLRFFKMSNDDDRLWGESAYSSVLDLNFKRSLATRKFNKLQFQLL